MSAAGLGQQGSVLWLCMTVALLAGFVPLFVSTWMLEIFAFTSDRINWTQSNLSPGGRWHHVGASWFDSRFPRGKRRFAGVFKEVCQKWPQGRSMVFAVCFCKRVGNALRKMDKLGKGRGINIVIWMKMIGILVFTAHTVNAILRAVVNSATHHLSSQFRMASIGVQCQAWVSLGICDMYWGLVFWWIQLALFPLPYDMYNTNVWGKMQKRKEWRKKRNRKLKCGIPGEAHSLLAYSGRQLQLSTLSWSLRLPQCNTNHQVSFNKGKRIFIVVK